MKDYSKYIKSEYGFITNIDTNIENKTIEVTTSKTKKGKPHVYKLNQENIKKLYNRLENQYKILIENKDEILEKINKEIESKTQWIQYIGCAIIVLITARMIIDGIISMKISTTIGLIAGEAMIYGPLAAIKQNKKSFNSMIETYKYYLANRHEIEALVRHDENILSNVNDKTYEEIENNQKLRGKNITQEIFDIQFMDKISLKQLKEIISNYQISKALEEEQYFYIEEEKTSKSRKRSK